MSRDVPAALRSIFWMPLVISPITAISLKKADGLIKQEMPRLEPKVLGRGALLCWKEGRNEKNCLVGI